MSNNDFLQQVIETIVGCNEDRAEELARQALAQGLDPIDVINNGYVAGIKKVGDMFEVGELFLPELIQAAEAVKKRPASSTRQSAEERPSSGVKC